MKSSRTPHSLDWFTNCSIHVLTWVSISSTRPLSAAFNRIRHLCMKERILKIISAGFLNSTPSIAILFLVVHRPQHTVAKRKSLRLYLAHPNGSQFSSKSCMLVGILSHPNASLKHAHVNRAITQLKIMWSTVSGHPHNLHL
uniref:Uncharacterized protein n=1 Tax=Setaria viridis TaxID=4556 RepID=A0A4U6VCR1_SETVI|nr:hypothetical protein SEVIR_3G192100v2 [Setaria viridis]